MKKRILSVILAACFIFSLSSSGGTALAVDGDSSLSEQRAEAQRKLDEIEKKLAQYDSQSEDTEEYLEALDKKIKYLTEQFNLTKSEYKSLEEKAVELENSISANEKEMEHIKLEVKELEAEIEELSAEFNKNYELYCKRLRAMYISGSFDSVLAFLIEGGGVQSFMTRLEMVRSVSKQDGELLESVRAQTTEIVDAKEKLDEKNKTLGEKQLQLKADKESLKTRKTELLEKQEEMNSQQAVIEEQQLEANQKLKRLHDKTAEYGEYRDMAQSDLDEIDDAIAEAAKKYVKPTTTAPTTTTTTTTNSKKSDGDADNTTAATTTTTTAVTSPPADRISLTYPCPSYTTITCGFGAYEGHTGCDFSTRGNEDQRIVASESGTVILVRLLERSYGHYIVIMHDKLTPSGKEVYTLYAHNNDIIVSEGQYVKKGQQIAYSGSTGNSTGPHCHFEVRVGGPYQSCAVDPAAYLP
ncbi:MAG: peptidoglycan DD-metalloendopeptidase family protein [Eubacterium sp.]|nr:peptidoglycan DD-metalloendopeptidase family protein [Eubacterium sp.]